MSTWTHSRRLDSATTCLSCDGPIEADERAYVEHGVGAWHEDCDPPLNLRLYRRERDAQRQHPRTPDLRDFDLD